MTIANTWRKKGETNSSEGVMSFKKLDFSFTKEQDMRPVEPVEFRFTWDGQTCGNFIREAL